MKENLGVYSKYNNRSGVILNKHGFQDEAAVREGIWDYSLSTCSKDVFNSFRAK